MKIKDLSPDTILSNGQIFTLDAQGTIAQAVAIKWRNFCLLHVAASRARDTLTITSWGKASAFVGEFEGGL